MSSTCTAIIASCNSITCCAQLLVDVLLTVVAMSLQSWLLCVQCSNNPLPWSSIRHKAQLSCRWCEQRESHVLHQETSYHLLVLLLALLMLPPRPLVQVVRTTIEPLHGGQGSNYDAYEYNARSHTYISDHQPTAKFSYDLSPMQVGGQQCIKWNFMHKLPAALKCLSGTPETSSIAAPAAAAATGYPTKQWHGTLETLTIFGCSPVTFAQACNAMIIRFV